MATAATTCLSGGDRRRQSIYGGEGDDELTGNGGSNVLDGGDGDDIVVYLDAGQVKVNLGDGTAIVVPKDGGPADPFGGGSRGTDSLTSIENVKGSHGDDTIDGDDNANLLEGLDGADTINGNGGDDTIIPNRPANADGSANVSDEVKQDDGSTRTVAAMDGEDTVNGGEGNDTISYEGEMVGVTVSLVPREDDAENVTADVNEAETTLATIEGGAVDSIATVEVPAEEEDGEATRESTIENIVGGAGDDVLTGDERGNTLEGNGGH